MVGRRQGSWVREGDILKPLFLNMPASMAPPGRRLAAGIADERPAEIETMGPGPAHPAPFGETLERASALQPDRTVIDWPEAEGIFARRKRSRAISLLSKRLECPIAVIHEKSGPECGAVPAVLDPDPTGRVLRSSAAPATAHGLPLDPVNVRRRPENHGLRPGRVIEGPEGVDRLFRSECQKRPEHPRDHIDADPATGDYRKLIHWTGGVTRQLSAISLPGQGSIPALRSRGRKGLAGCFPSNRAGKVIDSARRAVMVMQLPSGPRTVNEQRAT